MLRMVVVWIVHSSFMYPYLHQYPASNQSKTTARIPSFSSIQIAINQAKTIKFVQSIQEKRPPNCHWQCHFHCQIKILREDELWTMKWKWGWKMSFLSPLSLLAKLAGLPRQRHPFGRPRLPDRGESPTRLRGSDSDRWPCRKTNSIGHCWHAHTCHCLPSGFEWERKKCID